MSKKDKANDVDYNPFKSLDKNIFAKEGERKDGSAQFKIRDKRKILNRAADQNTAASSEDNDFAIIMNMGGVTRMKDNNRLTPMPPVTSVDSDIADSAEDSEDFWQQEDAFFKEMEKSERAGETLPKSSLTGETLPKPSPKLSPKLSFEGPPKQAAEREEPVREYAEGNDFGTLKNLLEGVSVKGGEQAPQTSAAQQKERDRSAPMFLEDKLLEDKILEDKLLKEYLASSKNIKNMRPKEESAALFLNEANALEAYQDSEEAAFALAMQKVTPITGGASRGREVAPRPISPPAVALSEYSNPLQDFMDGKIEFSLAFTEEYVEGHVLGLDEAVINQMKAGSFSFEAHLDLHGQNALQSFNSLVAFIKRSYEQGRRHVLIITGRGKNSPDGTSILRDKIQEWFTAEPLKRVVLAFCTALPRHGGAGALYVLLRKIKKSRGKIMWDKRPSDPDLFI